MIIDKKKINLWSKMGSRATFGLSLMDIVKEMKDLMVVTCDVSTSAGLDRFKKTYPENYIDVGIAEQNMIGIATGISMFGNRVITTTFSPFQTLRCCEQIKNNLGYMNSNVKMVGLASGLVLGTLGFTHASIEDIGALRSIPNMNIISPADSTETVKSIYASLNNDSPTYIRLTGGQVNNPIHEEDYNFEIGKAIRIKKGKEIAILASGTRVSDSVLASEKIYQEKNFQASVYNFHTIKPIDKNTIEEIANDHDCLVTVEEHNIIGGLGSAVSETLAEMDKKNIKLYRMGVEDFYPKGGDYNSLLKLLNLDKDGIYNKIIKLLS